MMGRLLDCLAVTVLTACVILLTVLTVYAVAGFVLLVVGS